MLREFGAVCRRQLMPGAFAVSLLLFADPDTTQSQQPNSSSRPHILTMQHRPDDVALESPACPGRSLEEGQQSHQHIVGGCEPRHDAQWQGAQVVCQVPAGAMSPPSDAAHHHRRSTDAIDSVLGEHTRC